MLYVLSVDIEGKTKYFSKTDDGSFCLVDTIYGDGGFAAIYSNKDDATEDLEKIVEECRDFYMRYADLSAAIGDANFHVMSVDLITKVIDSVTP